jgi:hypothetical protein
LLENFVNQAPVMPLVVRMLRVFCVDVGTKESLDLRRQVEQSHEYNCHVTVGCARLKFGMKAKPL